MKIDNYDKVEFTFNTPLKTSPDSQGFLFCTILKPMRKVIQNKPTKALNDEKAYKHVIGESSSSSIS